MLPEADPFPLAAPWNLVWLTEREPTRQRSIIESKRVPPDFALRSLAARGLASRRRNARDDIALADAEGLIASVPDLHKIVRERVRGLAMIASPGPDYDTSHSEPAWPGWIFVSIPEGGPRSALRLAEGVIHEAMHLNLTALEHHFLLTLPNYEVYSPWKQETRAASGVLHGFYVFVCLAAYFQKVWEAQSFASDAARSRIEAILGEIEAIERERLEAALSEPGLRFCQSLYDAATLVRSACN